MSFSLLVPSHWDTLILKLVPLCPDDRDTHMRFLTHLNKSAPAVLLLHNYINKGYNLSGSVSQWDVEGRAFSPFFSLFISFGAIWDNLQWLRWRATLCCLHTNVVDIFTQVKNEGQLEGKEGRKDWRQEESYGNERFGKCRNFTLHFYFFLFYWFTEGVKPDVHCIYKSSNMLT